MKDRPTVGITFFLRKGEDSIWNNGAAQNCVFLLQLLRSCSSVGKVIAINGGENTPPAAGLMLKDLGIEFVPIADAIDKVDLLIEAAAQVSAEHVERVHARGGKAVTFKFGNAFVIDSERMIHHKEAGAIFNGTKFDEVWTNPQHMATCESLWKTCYRAPVRVLPHIWEPTFVDAAVKEFPPGLEWGYKPGRKAKRIGVFEPNINIVKTCVTPMLICERLYRVRPELLGDVYVTNALGLKDHLTFQKFAGSLDMVRDKVCSFEGRFNTPWFMAKHCDIMLAHQWENSLNYAYYDALYGGYPLVHNSEHICCGYYYTDFDAWDGAIALQKAIEYHDSEHEIYQERANRFLGTVRATAKHNIEAHERAIHALH